MEELKVQPAVDTVYDICLRLNKLTQIPVQRQKLLCKHVILPRNDGRTLAEHGVKDGSKLHLVSVHRETGTYMIDRIFANCGMHNAVCLSRVRFVICTR